jgi:hypothetical protein
MNYFVELLAFSGLTILTIILEEGQPVISICSTKVVLN